MGLQHQDSHFGQLRRPGGFGTRCSDPVHNPFARLNAVRNSAQQPRTTAARRTATASTSPAVPAWRDDSKEIYLAFTPGALDKLDPGPGLQTIDLLLQVLLRQIPGQVGFDFFEVRGFYGPGIFQKNDVIAVLGLHRLLRECALFQSADGAAELGHHPAPVEAAQIAAAFIGAGISGFFHGRFFDDAFLTSGVSGFSASPASTNAHRHRPWCIPASTGRRSSCPPPSSAGGTKPGLVGVVVAFTTFTYVTIACLAAPSFHDGSGSDCACAPSASSTPSARSGENLEKNGRPSQAARSITPHQTIQAPRCSATRPRG